MSRFIPEIEKINNKYVLYHLTLTVPNCSGADLRDTIKNIFNSFKTLIEYLKLKKKIRGVDFSSWGYGGAIRSLEITFKKDSYHPHLHVLLALEKDMFLVKNIVNDYSYSYGEFKRCFSDREVLIQKVWYLLINGIRVTKKNIDNLDVGYSCNIDKFQKDDYAELFKYLTKEQDEEQNILTYENFKVLYSATYKCRQIQGYGCFYNLDFNEVDENEVDEIYSDIIEELQKKELPEDTFETPEALLQDSQYLLISRKKIFSYLRLK